MKPGIMEKMISVEHARRIIDENSFLGEPISVALERAGGSVLAEDLFSRIDIPSFPQSSMDGYAFSFAAWEKGKRLRLSGEVPAGSSRVTEVLPGEAIRIFTGAVVPKGADTVVMQEKSRLESGELEVTDASLQAGDYVRPQGAEIKMGTLALAQSTVLGPAAIGFLAGMGYSQVPVFSKPCISLIVTGNELQSPGEPLQFGQVYEANSFSLIAALQQLGMEKIRKYYCGDNLELLTGLLQEALHESDLVLITGGVSMGDYDFTLKAAEQSGVTSLFHKIKQRPGKPIYFGKKGSTLVFGLPGNPASVLTCFYVYVRPVIEKFMGMQVSMSAMTAELSHQVQKPSGITWFMKGHYQEGKVQALDAQESYRLSSFAVANCLILIAEDRTTYKRGDPVQILLLPVK